MKAFRRILQDVKNGENIDLYVTVIAAVGLAVMNSFGFVPTATILPLNLAHPGARHIYDPRKSP
jgi:hypothetical protein